MNPGIYDLFAEWAYFPADHYRPFTWARIGNSCPPPRHLHLPLGASSFLNQSASPIHVQLSTPFSAQWLITTVGTTGTEGVVEVVGASDAIEVSSYVQASFARN